MMPGSSLHNAKRRIRTPCPRGWRWCRRNERVGADGSRTRSDGVQAQAQNHNRQPCGGDDDHGVEPRRSRPTRHGSPLPAGTQSHRHTSREPHRYSSMRIRCHAIRRRTRWQSQEKHGERNYAVTAALVTPVLGRLGQGQCSDLPVAIARPQIPPTRKSSAANRSSSRWREAAAVGIMS